MIVNEAKKLKREEEPVYSVESQQTYIYPDSSDESVNNDDVDESDNKEVNNNDTDEHEEVEEIVIPQRIRQVPRRLGDCVVISDNAVNDEGDIIHFALLADSEPLNFEEALKIGAWKKSMIEELQSIEKNHTWELVNLPDKKKKIDVKWVLKLKLNPDGKISKHKAKLVAKGFLQKHGTDYNEVFAPAARLEIVRLIVALAFKRRRLLYHLNVKSASLNGPLEEVVFVSQFPGFEVQGKENMVYRLNKALYGLKQVPQA